jgi:hypothetical protein
MKRKLSVALGLAVIASLAVATPALAYTGISGTVIDSKTLQPWTHGGDVWIVNNTTGSIVATCAVDSSGHITDGGAGNNNGVCEYGEDYLGVGSLVTPAAGNQLEVVIDFSCTTSGACSGGSQGTPGFSSNPYTESPIPLLRNLGYIKTGTGPNAIVLADVTAQSSNLWLAVALAAVALMGAGGAVLLLRRRRTA